MNIWENKNAAIQIERHNDKDCYPKGYFQPVDLKKTRDSISRFIDGKYRLSIPANADDDDMLICRALDELEKYRLLYSDVTIDEFIDKLDTSEPTEMRVIREGFNIDLKKFK